MHLAGITHRDLRPENIILSDESDLQSLKLYNFKDNREAMVKARNYFAAPEILENGTSGDSPKRDLWSLGVMTYFFFTAKFPVFHENG